MPRCDLVSRSHHPHVVRPPRTPGPGRTPSRPPGSDLGLSLSPGPLQRPVEDVAARQPEIDLEVKWRPRLRHRPPLPSLRMTSSIGSARTVFSDLSVAASPTSRWASLSGQIGGRGEPVVPAPDDGVVVVDHLPDLRGSRHIRKNNARVCRGGGMSKHGSTKPDVETPGRTSPGGFALVQVRLLLEAHEDRHQVTVPAGVQDADLGARTGDLGRGLRVERRPVAVRVRVIERRDRTL